MSNRSSGITLNINLEDLIKGFDAHEQIKRGAEPVNPEESNKDEFKKRKNITPDFAQSYSGKGMLLDVII
ncbi:MAG: hypothetical protein GYA55_03260 [SAR324 cluster bacterium]|uniref:Uncharacterized protein n=1 Tax=SAR324 cluster bacterium TaxID=2024889 RepID=A0A7X9FPZ5_9DELT|nr:hypothetical protein [SAR324 cluster bacterium]